MSGQEANTNHARPYPATGTSPHLTDEATEVPRGEGICSQYKLKMSNGHGHRTSTLQSQDAITSLSDAKAHLPIYLSSMVSQRGLGEEVC